MLSSLMANSLDKETIDQPGLCRQDYELRVISLCQSQQNGDRKIATENADEMDSLHWKICTSESEISSA